jgi:hypothetical protein
VRRLALRAPALYKDADWELPKRQLHKVHSLTYRAISGADHGLAQQPWRDAYTSILVKWLTEMMEGESNIKNY